jgi:transcriptional regulator with XRE-family HTH domain
MNRIRDLREGRDLRQIDVATATGIDQRTLSNYETGKTNPDSYAIVRLSEFFHVSCDYLLGVTDVNIPNAAALSAELEAIKKKAGFPAEIPGQRIGHLTCVSAFLGSGKADPRPVPDCLAPLIAGL